MNQFIESLRRLYTEGKVSEETINRLFNDGKISAEEKVYILSID